MTHTYDMIGYAKQLQNDLKEFNGADVTLDEIIKEHDLKPNELYVTDNELVLLEVLENENWQRKLDLIDDKLFDLAMKYDELFELGLNYDDHTALVIDLRYEIIEVLKEHGEKERKQNGKIQL